MDCAVKVHFTLLERVSELNDQVSCQCECFMTCNQSYNIKNLLRWRLDFQPHLLSWINVAIIFFENV